MEGHGQNHAVAEHSGKGSDSGLKDNGACCIGSEFALHGQIQGTAFASKQIFCVAQKFFDAGKACSVRSNHAEFREKSVAMELAFIHHGIRFPICLLINEIQAEHDIPPAAVIDSDKQGNIFVCGQLGQIAKQMDRMELTAQCPIRIGYEQFFQQGRFGRGDHSQDYTGSGRRKSDMAQIVCLGEALIDFVANESGVEVGEASGFVKAAGGGVANVSVGLAKLGVSSAFLGKVGDDPFGRFLEQTFSDAGVDTSGMVFDKENRTGLAFVSLTDSGERDFCFFRNPSADMMYDIEELDEELIHEADCFHFGSITLIQEPSRATTLHAARTARDNDLLVSYDPNLRPPLWDNLQDAQIGLLSGVPFADIVKVSEEELAFMLHPDAVLSETPPEPAEIERLAKEFCERFPDVQLLAVTRGAKGCYWRTHLGSVGGVQVEKVNAIDTTGAGDGFVAGMLMGLLFIHKEEEEEPENWLAASEKLQSVLSTACIAGSLTTLKKGAIPALPTIEEINRFSRENPQFGASPSPDFASSQS